MCVMLTADLFPMRGRLEQFRLDDENDFMPSSCEEPERLTQGVFERSSTLEALIVEFQLRQEVAFLFSISHTAPHLSCFDCAAP